MSTMNTPNPVEAVTKAAHSTPKLQASAEAHHPGSWYDKKSSHYQGGAHNVLLNAARLNQEPRVEILSADAMGGNHNVAMAAMAEKSNQYKKARQAKAA